VHILKVGGVDAAHQGLQCLGLDVRVHADVDVVFDGFVEHHTVLPDLAHQTQNAARLVDVDVLAVYQDLA